MISNYQSILEGIFDKKFDLKVDGIPADCGVSLCHKQEDFDQLYTNLASMKNAFDTQEWYNHTTFNHAMKNLSRELKKKFGISYASQAYCKLTELFCGNAEMNINAFNDDVFYSLHLCEAPGAFIYATLDALRGKRVVDWTATSLNPHYEWNDPQAMFTDDDVICRHPDRWNFGRTNSGDIHEASAIDFGAKKFDLVTADGSLHCEGVRKESSAFSIFDAEVRVAMEVLRPGGDFVMKMYSFTTKPMRRLLGRCVNAFRTVRLCKPSASKPGNFEVYLVCCGFIPEPKAPQEIDDILYSAAAYFVRKQEEICRFNEESFVEWSRSLKNAILSANRNAMEGWISSFASVDSLLSEVVENPEIPWNHRKLCRSSGNEAFECDWTWSVEDDLVCGSRHRGPVTNSLFVPKDWNDPNNNNEDFAFSLFPNATACVDRFLDDFLRSEGAIRLNIGNRLALSRLSASVVGALCFYHSSVRIERGELVFMDPIASKREELRSFMLAVKSHQSKCTHEDLLSFISLSKMADAILYRILLGFNALQLEA